MAAVAQLRHISGTASLLEVESGSNDPFAYMTAFAGLRGAASAVFAIIAVNNPGYGGYDVYNIVFCVAVISVAFQGLLLPAAARKLDMVDDSQNVMKTFSDYQDDQAMQPIQIRLRPGHRYIG